MAIFAVIAINVLLVAVGITLYFSATSQKNGRADLPVNLINASQSKNMEITSPVFENNANISQKYTYDVEKTIKGHILEQAELVGLHERP